MNGRERANLSSGQGIDDSQVGKAAEVAVRGPQFTDPVLTAKRGDAPIMNPRTDDLACSYQ
jgi:hypothetical protein